MLCLLLEATDLIVVSLLQKDVKCIKNVSSQI